MLIPNILEIRNALCLGREKGCSAESLFTGKDGGSAAAGEYLGRYPHKAGEMRKLAEKYKSVPVISLRYSSYRQYDTTGERNDYQDEYFEHRDGLSVMGMCAWLFEEEGYLWETENRIWAVCEEYTWCLPAHLDGKSLEILKGSGLAEPKDGKIVPGAYDHRHTLDLFACETARELAEILHMVGKRISPQVRDRAVGEIIDRVFSQYLIFNKIPGFEISLSNWSAVCGGSIGVAALYLIEDEDLLAPVVQRVISDLDVFVSSYGEDGIGQEGIGYWNYGFSHFCYFAWLLKERTGGCIDLFADSKVKKIAGFPAQAFLYRDYSVNFSDCSGRGGCSGELFCCLREIYPDLETPTNFSVPQAGGDKRYIPVTLRKVIWEKEIPAEEFRERSAYFPDAGWLVSCVMYGSLPISCVVKGGSNQEPHNHNDLGHFILMARGEQLLCDLGSGEYTKEYFGAGRYGYLVTSSRGHSVPIIEGTCQREGGEAKILSVEQTDDRDEICMEIGSAYQVVALKAVQRRICIQKSEYSVLVQDTCRFTGDMLEVTERFVSVVEPQMKPNGDIWICGQSGCIVLSAEGASGMPVVSKEEFRKPGRQTGTAWLMDYPVRMRRDSGTFCLRISIVGDG